MNNKYRISNPVNVSLITGAAGMLGWALIPALKEAGHQVYPSDINTESGTYFLLDVRDYDKVLDCFKAIRPDIVFHLAAETDLEICESNPDHAYRTNTIGTHNVCVATRAVGAKMVYISTAGVFDGNKREPYTEFDNPNPINIYGRSKYEGEKIVASLMDRYFIIRAGWMIGGGHKDHKFVAKIIRLLNDGAKELHVVVDKLGTPTYNVDFCHVIRRLCQGEHYGLYHAACTGSGTRLDVASEIVAWMLTDINIIPVNSDYFPDYSAPRPRSEMMLNYMLELHGWNTMRDWRLALREYLSKNFQNIGKALIGKGER